MSKARPLWALLGPIADQVSEIRGDRDMLVDRAASLDGAGSRCLTYAVSKERLVAAIDEGMAGAAVICGEDAPEAPNVTLVVVRQPKLAFAMAATTFYRPPRAKHTRGATIYEGVVMDAGVVVEPGAVVGIPGFGFVRRPDGVLVQFPHLGGVRIRAGVYIGPHCVVQRGALELTVLEDGVKLDARVHVGHGCRVGAHTALAAHSVLCGHVSIGERCFIGAGALIREGVVVDDDATVGMGAVVVDDVPTGATVVGNPARRIR